MQHGAKTPSERPPKSDPSDELLSKEMASSQSDVCTSIELFGKDRSLRQNLGEDIDCIIPSDGVEVHFPSQKGVEVTENIRAA